MAVAFLNFSSLPSLLKLGKAYVFLKIITAATMFFPVVSILSRQSNEGIVNEGIVFVMALFGKFFLSQLGALIAALVVLFGINSARSTLFWGGIGISFVMQLLSIFAIPKIMNHADTHLAFASVGFFINTIAIYGIIIYVLRGDEETKRYFAQGRATV